MMIVLFTAHLWAVAQVGVNTDSPDQTLDVNGKVEIGDDSRTATAGTMRFNASDSEFQGYNGSSWVTFGQRGGPIPEGAIPVYGFATRFINSTGAITIRRADNDATVSQVPTGQFLIVTGVTLTSFAGTNTGFNVVSIGPSSSSGGTPLGSRNYIVKFNANEVKTLQSTLSPLFIAREGEFFSMFNTSTSTANEAFIRLQGFLVDNLDY